MLRAWGLALAVSVPAALLAQILDAIADGIGAVAYPLSVLVLAGAAVGGIAIRRPALGALVGAADVGVVVVLGIARHLAAGHAIPWGSALASTVLAAAIGATAAALAGARTARTRS
jgi:hypothetical protein